MKGLYLAPELTLPVDAVTETFAFLAKRGAGKTYAAKVLAEEMLAAGAQVVVLTPLDVWWGLRSSAAGDAGGYPIVLFGGAHGDVPIFSTNGAMVARLAVDEGVSMVVCLDGWSKNDQRRFAADFLETLFQYNSEPLHLIMEEADRWAPQKPLRGEERLLGAAEEIVRRGRSKGIGCTLITQRSAVLHKDVLTQTEVLVAMRTPAKHDRVAVDAWFEAHDAAEVDPDVAMADLPGLGTGEAWVSSPYWFPAHGLPGLVKVRFRPARTFDSSSTPKVGERQREVRTLADVDLGAIKEAMAETIERAKEDDPKELRRRIVDLERELRDRPTPEPEIREVEVPVLDPDLLVRLEELLGPAATLLGEVQERLAWDAKTDGESVVLARKVRETAPPAPPALTKKALTDAVDSATGLRHDLLVALAQRGPMPSKRLALQVGKSAGGGYYGRVLSAMKADGLIRYDRGSDVEITDAGSAAVGAFEPLPAPGAALLEWWATKVGGLGGEILRAVGDASPRVLTKEEVAAAVGKEPSGGYFGRVVSHLRGLGLLDGFTLAEDLRP